MKNLKFPLFSLLSLLAFSCQNDEPSFIEKDVEGSTSTQMGSDQTNARIAIAGHSYWYFYRGESSPNLFYAYSDDAITWSGNGAFSNNAKSNTGPAVTFANGKFIAVYRGSSSSQLFASYSSDGMNWAGNSAISGANTSESPAIVTLGSVAIAYFKGNSTTDIWATSSSDGITWSTPQKITPPIDPALCAGAPGAGVLTNFLGQEFVRLFYWQPDNTLVYRESTGGLLFSNAIPVVDCSTGVAVKTNAGVAVFNNPFGSGAAIAYKGLTSNELYFAQQASCVPGGGGFSITTIGAQTSNRPGMTYFGGKMTIVYKAQSTNSILYARSTNGINWTSNQSAIGETLGGGPWLISGF